LSKRMSSHRQENGRALTMRALRLTCRSSSRTPVNLHCEWLNVRCGLPRDCALSHTCAPSAPAREPAATARCERRDVARNALICDDGRKGYLRRHRPTVGAAPHLAPSAAPPLGQNTETSVSLASQLTAPSAWTARRFAEAASPFSPSVPFSPGGPFSPGVPCGPCGPCGPWGP
jgi:hypothetical protein